MTSEDDTNSIGATPDPFDPASLRLGQDFALNLGVKKALLTIPVRKPSKESWVRVHPNPDYSLVTTVIELKEEREFYLVAPALRSELASELVSVLVLELGSGRHSAADRSAGICKPRRCPRT